MKKTYKSRRPNNTVRLKHNDKNYEFVFDKNGLYETKSNDETEALDLVLKNFGDRCSFYEVGASAPKEEKQTTKQEKLYEVDIKTEPDENELVSYPSATIQAAARVLCDKYNLTMREVNTAAKIEAKAKELGCSFPNLKK